MADTKVAAICLCGDRLMEGDEHVKEVVGDDEVGDRGGGELWGASRVEISELGTDGRGGWGAAKECVQNCVDSSGGWRR